MTENATAVMLDRASRNSKEMQRAFAAFYEKWKHDYKDSTGTINETNIKEMIRDFEKSA